jgi:hypothetical protein
LKRVRSDGASNLERLYVFMDIADRMSGVPETNLIGKLFTRVAVEIEPKRINPLATKGVWSRIPASALTVIAITV